MKFVVTTKDKEEQASEKISLVVALDNLRSAENVGNIFRLCDALNIEQILTCGYTATPPHAKLEKTSRGTDRKVSCKHYASTLDAVLFYKEQGYKIVAVETSSNATCIYDASFHEKTVFVFGNEALGISQEVLNLCCQCIYLPMRGYKNSINVASCAAVVLYQAYGDIK